MHQCAFACTPGMLSFHLYQTKPHPCSVVHSGITLSRKPPFVCSRSFLHAISQSSGCSGVSTVRVSVPTRLWPLKGRVNLLHPYVLTTQTEPRAQLEAAKEMSLQ